MPRLFQPAIRRLHGHPASSDQPQGLPAWDALRTVGRGLMGGLVGALIDALSPGRPDAGEDGP